MAIDDDELERIDGHLAQLGDFAGAPQFGLLVAQRVHLHLLHQLDLVASTNRFNNDVENHVESY